MTIAKRLKWVLESHAVEYEIISHAHTRTSLDSAHAAHVPEGRVAKCVLLEDERGYLLAIVPASCHVALDALDDTVGRSFELASEGELQDIFVDCERGAIPPFGAVHPIPMAIDDSLLRLPDVYFEAGDHEGLVHVSGEAFKALMGKSQHGRFGAVH
jgi:Ala-tRNA(Pro) deacylase